MARLKAAAAAVAFAAVLAATGYASGLVQAGYVASALISLTAPAANEGVALTAEQANRFVQTTIIFYNTDAFASRVARQVDSSEPLELSVEQVGTTDVVEVRAVLPDALEARRAADSAAATMVEEVNEEAAETVAAQRKAIDDRLKRLAPNRTARRRRQPLSEGAQLERRQLLDARGRLVLAEATSADTAEISLAATAVEPEKAVSPLSRAAVLGLFGLVLAVGVILLRQRRIAARATKET